MSRSPAVILYGPDGTAMAVEDGVAIPANTRGLVAAGKDGTGKSRFVSVDRYTGSIASIDHAHWKIHESKHYYVQAWSTLSGVGTTYDFLLDVGAGNYPHLVYSFGAQAAFTYALYEGTAVSANGAAASVFNNNRNSSNTPIMTVYAGPTVTALGTMLASGVLSGGMRTGGAESREDELILKAGEKFLVRFTKIDAGSSTIEYNFRWYES